MTSPAADSRSLLERSMREQDLQGFVLNAARDMGWRVYHARPGMMRSGRWSTPTQGHTGWPDLALCKDGRLLFFELKAEKGKVSEEQQQWLDALAACPGVDARVVRPGDWIEGRVLEWLR